MPAQVSIARGTQVTQTINVLSGTLYRLGSSMSDHMLKLFNVFEDWNEESIVPHISFVSQCYAMHECITQ